jgi:hypothetical protein
VGDAPDEDGARRAETVEITPVAGMSAAPDGDAGGTVTEEHDPAGPAEVEPKVKTRKRGRIRSILVGLLVLLTALSVIIAATATWAHRTVFNTDAWLEIIGPLPQEPGVADAASQFVVKQIGQVTDLQATVTAALPDQLAPLVPVVADRVRQIVETQLASFIGGPTFHQAWLDVNRAAHDAAVRVLRGESTRLVTGPNGEVSLNLVPLVYRGLEFLQDHVSFVLRGHTVPTGVDPVNDPAGAVAALSTEFGRPLPADFAQPVVFQSESLAAAQQAVKLFDTLFIVALLLPLVLAAIAILLSRRRRRTVVQLAVAAAVAVVLAAAVVRKLQEAVVDKVKTPTGRAAVNDTVSAVVHGLRQILIAVLILGAVIAIVAYLSGRPKWVVRSGAAVRRWSSGPRARGAEAYVAGHQSGLVWGGVALAIGVLFLTGLSWTPFLVIASFLALWIVGVLAVGRRVASDAGPLAPVAVG